MRRKLAEKRPHPYFRDSLFNKKAESLLPMGLFNTLSPLFKRMFPKHEFDAVTFLDAHTRYIDWADTFSSESMGLKGLKQAYELKVRGPICLGSSIDYSRKANRATRLMFCMPELRRTTVPG